MRSDMGLFDDIKKKAPHIGVATGVAMGAAAGAVAGQAIAEELKQREEAKKNNTSPTSASEETLFQNTETGVITHNYPNGSTLTEYPDGSRSFYDISTGKVTGYDAKTGETITYEANLGSSPVSVIETTSSTSEVTSFHDAQTGAVTHHYFNGNKLTEYPDGSRNFYDASTGIVTGYNAQTGETITYEVVGDGDSTTYDLDVVKVTATTKDGSQAVSFTEYPNVTATSNSSGTVGGGLFNGIPGKFSPEIVQEVRTYRQGSLEDGQVRQGFEARYGWENNFSGQASSQDEITLGVTINSEASFNSHHFVGASAEGEVGAEWNSEQASAYVQARVAVGAEGSVDGTVKETVEVDGLGSVGGEAQGRANAFAGAEAEGIAGGTISRDGADLGAQGSAFAGARAGVDGNAGLGANGDEFARVHGGANVRAGIGIDGNFNVGVRDGEINFNMGTGAALGVGAGYKISGSVDAPGIITHPDAVVESVIQEVVSIPSIPEVIPTPPPVVNETFHHVNEVINTDPRDWFS